MSRLLKVLLTACAFMVPASTMAADANEKSIKARKAYMQVLGHNMGNLGAMAKGKVPYDAAKASMFAGDLNLAAQMRNGAMWPKGSDAGAYPGKTRAKSEVWSTYPKVAEKGKALKTAAAALAMTAGDGLEALQAGMKAVGKSCGGCHKPFRAPKK
jgi:cytochrome c556